MATPLGELVERLRQVERNCEGECWEYSAASAREAADRIAALNRLMPAIEQMYVNVNGEDVFDGVLASHVRRDLLALR